MLEQGQALPNILLQNQDGEEVNLTTFKGKYVVLYIYPKDDTPGCTTEAIDFTTLKAAFSDKNAVVFGLSKDSIKKHKNFCEKHNLGVSLLSDPENKVIEQLGAWQEKSMYGKKYMGIVRSTFLINPEGVIEKVWPKVKVKGHAQDVLDSITV